MFDIPESKMGWVIGQEGDRFRTFKSHLTTTFIRGKKKVTEKPPPKYTAITQQEWDAFVKSRQTKAFKVFYLCCMSFHRTIYLLINYMPYICHA